MVDINPTMSIITLNMNGLKQPTKIGLTEREREEKQHPAYKRNLKKTG